jgi:hypothetical protein
MWNFTYAGDIEIYLRGWRKEICWIYLCMGKEFKRIAWNWDY